MGKLTPIPNTCRPKLDWSDLDRHLQMNFSNVECGKLAYCYIDPADYQMTKEEIVSEVQKLGLICEDSPTFSGNRGKFITLKVSKQF